MPVYQPNAVIGNSRVLVSIGAHAELMTFFYPHIDFAQNLHEGMPAIFFPAEGTRPGRLVWTFDPSIQSSQRYFDQSNIVETQLTHATGLSLRIVDFIHPSEPIFFRRLEASNTTSRAIRVKLFQYLDLQLGEVEQKNAVHYHADRGLAIAYWRNICFALVADPFEEFGCGRATPGSGNSAKLQMERGSLNGQTEEIGNIDLALGWDLTLQPGITIARNFIIAAASNEVTATERAEGVRELGWEAMERWTRSHWQERITHARPLQIEQDLNEAYHRCLLAIDLLADPDTGSILAAPEFDPFFERSGGYGYCWPRDAVDICLSLEGAGYPEYMARFLSWAKRTQRPEGFWEQRYWLNGERGPAWCTSEARLQIDQTASVLFAMGRHFRTLSGAPSLSFLEDIWDSALRAANYLTSSIAPETGLHTTAFDLWETFSGTFTYSNATISSALREAAYLASHAGFDTLSAQWLDSAAAVKQVIMSRLWDGNIFIRGLDGRGRPDPTADASTLGLIEPFEFLRIEDEAECEIARKCLDGLITRLGYSMDGAETLYRFEGDQYAGGGPGALTTLWFARVLLRIAVGCQKEPSAAADYRTRAVASMRAVLRAGTSTGLLPEMMGAGPHLYWAVPHAWTMASFIAAVLLLNRLPNASTLNI